MVCNFMMLRHQGAINPFASMANGGGKGGSAPAPDYTPMATASKEAAEIGAKLGREQLAENKRQYDLNMSTLQPVIDASIKQQQQAYEQGAQNFDTFTREGRPVQQTMLYDALGLSPEEIAQYNALVSNEQTAYNNMLKEHQATQAAAAPKTVDYQLPSYDLGWEDGAVKGSDIPASASSRPWLSAFEGLGGQSSPTYDAGSYYVKQADGSYRPATQRLTEGTKTISIPTYAGSNASSSGLKMDSAASQKYLAERSADAKQRQLDEAAGTAMADARAGSNQQMQQLIRQGLRYGWSPAKLASMGGAYANQGMQTQVTAANAARTQADAKRTAKLGDVYNTYAGAMSSAPAFYQAGTGAGNAASGSQLGMSGQYMGGMNAGNGLIMQGNAQQMTGLGSILNSQTSAYNASLANQANQSSPLAGIAGMALGGWAGGGFVNPFK